MEIRRMETTVAPEVWLQTLYGLWEGGAAGIRLGRGVLVT